MDPKATKRPKSLLEMIADKPIKDNKYIIVESEHADDNSMIPKVLKEFKVNRNLMKADTRLVPDDKFMPLTNTSYVKIPRRHKG